MQLNGRVGIVTGSTKGIGFAIATAMVDAGASVVVSSRTEEDVAAAVRSLEGRGKQGRVTGIPCDVRDPDACTALVDGAVSAFGRLDVLVNNAGVGRFAPIGELSVGDWRAQIDTNLNGVFYCSTAAVPHLEAAGGGWIVNIGSLAGKNAFAGGAGYNASKFGLLGLTEAMMMDLRHENIRVSVVMPGSVETHFSGPGEAAAADGPAVADEWKLRADDCARAVVHLLSYPERALVSRVELRPSRPPRK